MFFFFFFFFFLTIDRYFGYNPIGMFGVFGLFGLFGLFDSIFLSNKKVSCHDFFFRGQRIQMGKRGQKRQRGQVGRVTNSMFFLATPSLGGRSPALFFETKLV